MSGKRYKTLLALYIIFTALGAKGCNFDKRQCIEEYVAGRITDHYLNDCYNYTNANYELTIKACVDNCVPEIKSTQNALRCQDYCKSKCGVMEKERGRRDKGGRKVGEARAISANG